MSNFRRPRRSGRRYDRHETPQFLVDMGRDRNVHYEGPRIKHVTLLEDCAMLRQWLLALVKENAKRSPNYTPLENEVKSALTAYKYHLDVDFRTGQWVVVEDENSKTYWKAQFAYLFAELMRHKRDRARIRACRECQKMFVTPSKVGRRKDFCSATCGGTNRSRRYWKNRIRKEQQQ
jgi:predicted RNA-binding Zn ribbon-like protein